MTANELRIGNYLTFLTENRQVDALSIKLIDEGRLTLVKPIKITIEWLEKFGFVDESIMLKTPDRHLCLSAIVASKCYFYLSDAFGDNWSLNYIQYIHELQNLYFVLTGQELKLIEK